MASVTATLTAVEQVVSVCWDSGGCWGQIPAQSWASVPCQAQGRQGSLGTKGFEWVLAKAA